MESAERPLLEYLAQRSLTFPGASLFRAQCFTFVVVHQRSRGESKNPMPRTPPWANEIFLWPGLHINFILCRKSPWQSENCPVMWPFCCIWIFALLECSNGGEYYGLNDYYCDYHVDTWGVVTKTLHYYELIQCLYGVAKSGTWLSTPGRTILACRPPQPLRKALLRTGFILRGAG